MSEAFRLDRGKMIAHAVYGMEQLAAIKALGIEWIETDIYWVNGSWRVGHPRIWRPAGASEDLVTGEWHNVPATAPTLLEFVAKANEVGLRVMIEVKPSDVELRNEEAHAQLLAAWQQQNIIMSFDADYMLGLSRSGMRERLVVLVDSIISESAIMELAEADIDMAVGIWRITRRFIDIVRRHGLKVYAFTIDTHSDAERAALLCGSDVQLICNNCEELLDS